MAQHRSARYLAASLGVGVAATALVAMTPASATTPTKKHVTVTVTELPAQVRLVPRESVAVRLTTNVTTGYSWSTKVVGKNAAITVSDGVYTAPASGLIGAPGTTTWTVKAKAKGTAVVKFLATPPGGGKATPEGSLTVIVR